jgi:hypothetical protein
MKWQSELGMCGWNEQRTELGNKHLRLFVCVVADVFLFAFHGHGASLFFHLIITVRFFLP